MTPRVRRLFDAAKADEDYKTVFLADPRSKIPGFWADDLEESIFAAVYGGYLMGIHGMDSHRVCEEIMVG